MKALLTACVLVCEAVLAAMVAYLVALSAAAWRAPRRTTVRLSEPSTRFVVLIPAHNEEQLLPQTLTSLQRLAYPPELFEIHVIADNCSDASAEVARAYGAIAHERFDQERRGKGYALNWMLERLEQLQLEYDALLILDADTQVSEQFLSVMDARIARGQRVIQGYYAVLLNQQSWSIGLRSAAFSVLHYLRPQARMLLGGSAGLKGNGMVFRREIAQAYRWSNSLTEDIEFHMQLLLAGERVMFAPDATLWAEMPDQLATAQSQNERWEKGRMEMITQYVPGLLSRSLKKRDFRLADAAIEQLIPPFSIFAGLSVVAAGLAFALRSRLGIILACFNLVGQFFYILSGLLLVKAPASVYRSLLFAPFFVLWKIWIYIRLLLGRKPRNWIRTVRNQR
jgi:1,2-diacylglycerol 3-beta-glucosyltransferase